MGVAGGESELETLFLRDTCFGIAESDMTFTSGAEARTLTLSETSRIWKCERLVCVFNSYSFDATPTFSSQLQLVLLRAISTKSPIRSVTKTFAFGEDPIG